MSRPARAGCTAARALGACSRGAAAVEFAIIGGVLVVLLIGILDLGRALWTQNQMAFLADKAVRHVLIDPTVTEAALELEAKSEFTAGDPATLVFDAPPAVSGENYRVVSIDFPFTFLTPGIAGTITLDVTRRVPVM